MDKKIIISLLFISSLSFIFCNEIRSVKNFNFNFNNSLLINSYDTGTMDKSSNIYKSNKMKKFGNSGIPLTVIGGTTMIGGLVMFGIFYSGYYSANYNLSKYYSAPVTLYYLLYTVGILIASIGELLLLVGIAFMAIGYGVSKYYLKKEKSKITLQPFMDSEQNYFSAGLKLKFL